MQDDGSMMVVYLIALGVSLGIMYLVIKAAVTSAMKEQSDTLSSILELKAIEMNHKGISDEAIAAGRNKIKVDKLNEELKKGNIAEQEYRERMKKYTLSA